MIKQLLNAQISVLSFVLGTAVAIAAALYMKPSAPYRPTLVCAMYDVPVQGELQAGLTYQVDPGRRMICQVRNIRIEEAHRNP